MEEQFEQLRQALSQDIDKMLDEKLDRKLDEKFAGAEKRLAAHVSKELDTTTQHLKGLMQVHFEDMQGLVKVAADGYGGVLERIEQRLADLNHKVDNKFEDYDRIIKDPRVN